MLYAPSSSSLRLQVSDGIIAPGYTPGALEILKAKKGGAFVILAAKPGYKPPAMEYREVYGACVRAGKCSVRVCVRVFSCVCLYLSVSIGKCNVCDFFFMHRVGAGGNWDRAEAATHAVYAHSRRTRQNGV
jgi:hypothetical protein